MVGSLNTSFNYGIYAGLLFLGAGHVLAATASFCIGLIVSFNTHGRIVFQNRGMRGFVPFVLSWILIYVAYVAALDLLVGAGMNAYLAGAVLLPPVVLLSFLILRYVVFRPAAPGPKP